MMLLLERFSETELFRHLSEDVFGARNFQITKSMRVIFVFAKYSKLHLDFKHAAKYSENFSAPEIIAS